MHIVVYCHLVLGVVEEVVEEVLEVGLCRGGREAPDPCGQDVHVEHGYLGPGAEGGFEAELCLLLGRVFV